MSAVPTVYGALTRVPIDADISSLRNARRRRLPAAVLGAGRASPSTPGVRLLEGYGLTEATCASTFTPPGRRSVRVGRDGRCPVSR